LLELLTHNHNFSYSSPYYSTYFIGGPRSRRTEDHGYKPGENDLELVGDRESFKVVPKKL
jgi:hypothetical protein